MGRRSTHDAEVFRSGDDSLTEQFLPEPINRHSCGQGIGRIDDPLSQPQSILWSIRRQWMQRGGRRSGNLFAHTIVLTTHQNICHRRFVCTFHLHVSHRTACFDGSSLVLQCFNVRGQSWKLRVVVFQVVLEEFGRLSIRPLVGRSFEDASQQFRLSDGSDFIV